MGKRSSLIVVEITVFGLIAASLLTASGCGHSGGASASASADAPQRAAVVQVRRAPLSNTLSIAGEFLGTPGGAVPQNGVAMTDFDGHGGLTQVDYVVINGSPTGTGFQSETGTYSVNSDCTGTLTFAYSDGTQITLQLVVVDHGNQFRTVVSKLVLLGKAQSVNIASSGVRVGDADRK